MQVFKTYHIIIKNKFLAIAILVVAYLGLSMLYSQSGITSEINSFSDLEVQIAIFDDDLIDGSRSKLVEGLINYLSMNTEIVDAINDKEDIQKALFSNEIQTVIIIPNGFARHFFDDNTISIHQMSKPESIEAVFVQAHINKFFNKVKENASFTDSKDLTQIIESVNDELSKRVKVEVLGDGNVLFEITKNMVNHYNFLGFYLLYSIISGVGMSMMAFNKPEIIVRNNASSLSISNRNIQLLLGNLTYVLFCWGVGMLISIIFFREQFSITKTILFSLNTLFFSTTCLSIGFLMGMNLRNKNTFNSLVGIVILSMTFIGGLFIPLEMMSTKIIKIAQFTPIYWYIKVNNNIQNIEMLTTEHLSALCWEMFMISLFGIVIFTVAIIISKYKYTRLYSH